MFKYFHKMFIIYLYFSDLDFVAESPERLKQTFDVVIDCSGSAAAVQAAIPLLGPGGRLCVFGVANPSAKFSIEPYEVS